MFRRSRPPLDYVRVQIPGATGLSAHQILLLGDIRAMEERIIQRRLWSARSIRELLQAAVDATVSGGDPEQARFAFDKAEKIFQDDVQTKNRMLYLLGTLLGGLAIAAIAWLVLEAAQRLGVQNLAEPDKLISLFTFAGMGSAASVLARLSTIDLKNELRKVWVVVSAGTRPLLSIALASVVYVILENDLVTITGFQGPSDHKNALLWTAAFLCGFSERFAMDILDRLPFANSSASSASDPDEPSGAR
jgi:hypothetical protein